MTSHPPQFGAPQVQVSQVSGALLHLPTGRKSFTVSPAIASSPGPHLSLSLSADVVLYAPDKLRATGYHFTCLSRDLLPYLCAHPHLFPTISREEGMALLVQGELYSRALNLALWRFLAHVLTSPLTPLLKHIKGFLPLRIPHSLFSVLYLLWIRPADVISLLPAALHLPSCNLSSLRGFLSPPCPALLPPLSSSFCSYIILTWQRFPKSGLAPSSPP